MISLCSLSKSGSKYLRSLALNFLVREIFVDSANEALISYIMFYILIWIIYYMTTSNAAFTCKMFDERFLLLILLRKISEVSIEWEVKRGLEGSEESFIFVDDDMLTEEWLTEEDLSSSNSWYIETMNRLTTTRNILLSIAQLKGQVSWLVDSKRARARWSLSETSDWACTGLRRRVMM